MSKNNKLINLSPEDFLYGQSTLKRFKINFEILEKIADYILKTENLQSGRGQILSPISGYEVYVEQIQDICEKLDFLRVCLTTTNHLEHHIDDGVFVFHVEETKFFFYTFIYNLKALMDSISMLLREVYELYSFTKGNIDIIRKQQFKDAVTQQSAKLTYFFKVNVAWTNMLLKFRDRLIHRNRTPIFIKDKDSQAVFWIQFVKMSQVGKRYFILSLTGKKVPVLSFKDEKIGLRKPFAYVHYKKPITLQEILKGKRLPSPSDFKSISDLCSKSFNLSKSLIEIVLGELYTKLSAQ